MLYIDCKSPRKYQFCAIQRLTTWQIMESVILPRQLVNQILHLAQSSPDIEVCGLISAKNGRPYRCLPIANISDQPQRLFSMDEKQQIQALRRMRVQGEQLFGIFHSHPHSPATPSSTDLDEAGYPNALYLIVSLNTRGVLEMRGYRLRDGQATDVLLEI
jgi:proteasome lid subunit RPN8/RPN11